MNETPGIDRLDAHGLPKLQIHDGKVESDNRDFGRAPITSGGTITGQAFQTSGVDPRITIDSTSLICHNTAGQTTFQIDIATGVVSLLYGSGVSATLRWVDTSGATQAQISFSATTSGLLLDSLASTTIFASNAIGTLGTPSAFVQAIYNAATPNCKIEADFASGKTSQISVSSATGAAAFGWLGTDGTRTSQISFNTQAASVNFIAVGEATARVRIGSGANAGTNPVDFIGGNIVFQTADKYTGNIAGQIVLCGVRCLSTLANAAYGGDINWRHMRTDTAGATVTPGSVTFSGAPSLNTNAAVPQVRILSSRGGSFTISPAATGVGDYLNTTTVN